MAALFLPCAQGVEELLLAEVQRIGQQQPAAESRQHKSRPAELEAQATRGGVWVQGDEAMAMRLNLQSRLAQRVLWPLIDAPYRDEHDLYDMARHVPWGKWLTPSHTLRVDVSAQRSPLRSLNFCALRIKDAICDTLRDSTGERPSVDIRQPDLPVALFVGPDHATLYVDTSGEPLFKRGWREFKGEAPLKETLAAAMLAAAGWQGRSEDGPLLDPCCGAGTIAIEAAQMACGIAPGSQRHFSFERQLPFQPHLAAWREMKREAQAQVHAPAVAVFAGDVSFRMTDFAQRNAQLAGVQDAIEFKSADALQRLPPAAQGTMLINPPYGERMEAKGTGSAQSRPGYDRHAPQPRPARQQFEADASSSEFFSALAAHWKSHYDQWTAWLLSPDMKLPHALRLKESRRVPMWNGGIECRLFRFDITARGSPAGDAGGIVPTPHAR